MDVQELKERIKLDGKTKLILEGLGMKYIRPSDEFISCCMPDGDNKTSTIVYKDSLYVDAHTRDIQDKNGVSDIISLVSYINKSYFSQSLKWICDICKYDYYGKVETQSTVSKWMRDMFSMNRGEVDEDDIEIKPIDECLLNYYRQYQNEMFFKDGISLDTQREFGIGYDLDSHRITIPIRDELGTLIGVKGRLFQERIKDGEMKYCI